jgi:hypothetical protein
LIGGAGSDTMTGGAHKDFFAAGKVSDTITTGATSNIVATNLGNGALTLQPTTGATDVLSLGGGIDTEKLTFTKSGNNLVLSDGSGDTVTFTNWYAGVSNQNVTTLQVIEIASSSYNSASSDPLRNQAIEEFNFTSLVSQFNAAGSPSGWALSGGMATAQLADSATAAYGGDLAYYYGLNQDLTSLNLSAAQSTLTSASFATATQTIDAWAGISGGVAHLLAISRQQASLGEGGAASSAGSSGHNAGFVSSATLRSHALGVLPSDASTGGQSGATNGGAGSAWDAMHASLDLATRSMAWAPTPSGHGAEVGIDHGLQPGDVAAGALLPTWSTHRTIARAHVAYLA